MVTPVHEGEPQGLRLLMEQAPLLDPRKGPAVGRKRRAKVSPSSHSSCLKSLGRFLRGKCGHEWEAGWSPLNQILPAIYSSVLACHLGFFLCSPSLLGQHIWPVAPSTSPGPFTAGPLPPATTSKSEPPAYPTGLGVSPPPHAHLVAPLPNPAHRARQAEPIATGQVRPREPCPDLP